MNANELLSVLTPEELSTPNEVSDLIISLITLGELICNQEEYKKVYDFYTEWVNIYNNGEK